ncbi:hypothetical protein PPACK8108_LOCUS10915 [Phakopsora pachyrhizi]|uniref:Uncharacterized protein n=1 Tax=Phakopsora pachyrhizi TaxID=170000 RepID=A0AAV0AZ83_PHAPC|nr:hypothetical protein PPACK8108_LOCUS10915 [Phakopsora pachyrhizi]
MYQFRYNERKERMINKRKGKGKLFDERKAEGGRRVGEQDELKKLVCTVFEQQGRYKLDGGQLL